jgi:hypothetical protein
MIFGLSFLIICMALAPIKRLHHNHKNCAAVYLKFLCNYSFHSGDNKLDVTIIKN